MHDSSKFARFPVSVGETVTSWALSEVSGVYYPGTSALAEDRVNYRFINGFVDVGDLPCRKAVWADIANRTVELERDWEVESINLPGFNRRLEFSSFWHVPTRLKRWCRTILEPAEDGAYDFRIATCGGVHIWVDGELAAKFEPYSRNKEQSTDVTLQLKASGSEVIMLSEEMAERDTNWYVEFTLLGPKAIQSAVPGSADPKLIADLMSLARDVRPKAEFTTGKTLELVFDHAPDRDVLVKAKVLPSVHMRDHPPLLDQTAILKAGETSVLIDGVGAMPDAYHALELVFSVGDTRVNREIAFALLREEKPQVFAETLAQRKQDALIYAATHGEDRIGRALAILGSGQGCTAHCQALIKATLQSIDERRDCSDFVMVPLLWLVGAYGDQVPKALLEQITASVLNYRYWVDEPGNDTMWFWSENHVLCFHVSQYLAGHLFKDDVFVTSGRTGAEQKALAEERLALWFTSVEGHGFAEWNSAAYYPIDFIGLLALQHWGEGEVCSRAAGLLDSLFEMISLHTLAGVPSGSMGRAYDKELRAGPCTELAPFASVAFGLGWFNDGVAALPMFCLGSYEPPKHLINYALPGEEDALTAHYAQGYGNAAKLALFKTASVQLSASVDGEPGHKGHQQHMLDVRFAGHPYARAWVNHPGEDDPWGHQRPSYWAGNGSMPRVDLYENAALMLFDIPKNHRIDFTHIYAPLDAFDQWTLVSDYAIDWLLLRSGNGWAAITPCTRLTSVDQGPGQKRELRAAGRKAGWVVLVGDMAAEASLDSVKDIISQTNVHFDPEMMGLHLERPGAAALSLDYQKGLFVDGTISTFPNPTLKPNVSKGLAPTLRSNDFVE